MHLSIFFLPSFFCELIPPSWCLRPPLEQRVRACGVAILSPGLQPSYRERESFPDFLHPLLSSRFPPSYCFFSPLLPLGTGPKFLHHLVPTSFNGRFSPGKLCPPSILRSSFFLRFLFPIPPSLRPPKFQIDLLNVCSATPHSVFS